MIKIYTDYEVKKHSTFKIGARVKKAAFPETIGELIELINSNEYDLVLGNCSNVLFSSQDIDKNIIFTEKINKYNIDGHKVYVSCGTKGPIAASECAKRNPYEWQLPENIVYCDYLEHLLLHILICEGPSKNKNDFEVVGIGGVINFLVPELNDLYSGWITKQEWRANCHSRVVNDKEVYLILLKRFKSNFQIIFFIQKIAY